MVELCELQLNIAGDDCWPADLDAHIAALDFERSEFSTSSALFNELSTDSLDPDQLHAVCQPCKTDYHLTFSDSVISDSEGNHHHQDHHLTTWGRIRSADPLDENTNSLPANSTTPLQPIEQQKRPNSLLATFIDRQTVPDYEYSELYVGDGRYVDVNENEIGFVPASTAGLQHMASTADRWRAANHRLVMNNGTVPRRTFADLLEHQPVLDMAGPSKVSPMVDQTPRHLRHGLGQSPSAPQLEFLRLPHQMGALCRSAMGIEELIERVRSGVVDVTEETGVDLNAEPLTVAPDSGLGTSGPSHIEDWQSLSVLLPSHVVRACSFFKSHSDLLTGSSSNNSIERPRRPPITIQNESNNACRNCLGLRRRLHPPRWAHANRRELCDCTTSQTFDRSIGLSMRADELAVLGMPIYRDKRTLVEAVVEAIAALMAGSGGAIGLIQALRDLIADGLKAEFHVWTVIVAVTGKGPATKNIHRLVRELDKGDQSLNGRVSTFFAELINLRCLDCWLSYVVLKQNILVQFYNESGFVMQAAGAYRSLLHRLIETIECLSVNGGELLADVEQRRPTRLAADSRVPKSSSMPCRLSCSPTPIILVEGQQQRRGSRIPLPGGRRFRSIGASFRREAACCVAKVREDVAGVCSAGSLLAVSRGEHVQVLTSRGMYAHCWRLRPRRAHVQLGLVHRSNLILNL